MKRKTIIDIARTLGLSPSTVSRSLNNHPDIKEATKADICKVAELFDYRPSPMAKSLKRNYMNRTDTNRWISCSSGTRSRMRSLPSTTQWLSVRFAV